MRYDNSSHDNYATFCCRVNYFFPLPLLSPSRITLNAKTRGWRKSVVVGLVVVVDDWRPAGDIMSVRVLRCFFLNSRVAYAPWLQDKG